MRSALIIGLMACSLAASAGVYRWVDENGKVHYGDRPPAQAEQLNPPPPPADPDPAAQQPAATAPPPSNKGVYKQASFREICDELNARLVSYRGSPELAVGDPAAPTLLSAAERQELIDTTQAQADAACAKAPPES